MSRSTEPPLDETRIALLRRADGLFVLSLERQDPAGDLVFREHLRPLEARDHVDRQLLQAWAELSSVSEIDSRVLEAVRIILAGTVVDPEGPRPSLGSLRIAPRSERRAPTAAHPRAYKGTKAQPPKPRRPTSQNLQPFLCVVGGQDRLVRMLVDVLGSVDLPAEPRHAPPGFRRGLAWLAQMHPTRFGRALALHGRLDLEHDLQLRWAVAWLTARVGDLCYGWNELAGCIERAQRCVFVDLVWQTGVAGCDPTASKADLLAIAATSSAERFRGRVRYALRVLAMGGSVAAVRDACGLADAHAPSWDFSEPGNMGDALPLDADGMARLRGFAARFYDGSDRGVLRLWAACCSDESLPEELEWIATRRIDSAAARALAGALADAVLDDDVAIGSWSRWRAPLRRFVQAVEAAPFQTKAVDLLRHCVWESAIGNLGWLASLVPIVCAEPFAPGGSLPLVAERFGELSEAGRASLLKVPVRSLLTLEAMCRRRNDAWLICYGVGALVDEAEEWFCRALVSHARTLGRAAQSLGLFSASQRKTLLRQVLASPLAVDVAMFDGPQLADLYARHGPGMGASPIPKALRRHLAGEAMLTTAQLERATAVVRSEWPRVLCESLNEAALRHMAQSLGAMDVDLVALNDSMVHALRLQTGLDDNRRSLRRLLRARFRGEDDYVRTHPANRAWLGAHPRLSENRWLEGLTIARELGEFGSVTLALESDPLESLRLGTYVGSCLGLGGGFTASAAAIALDVNKQVVFARDTRGRFLARQVIAITDDERLACYAVYPREHDALVAAFAAYDRAFAAYLGVEIEPESAEDKVALTVATQWWDDGVWDVSAE